MGNEVDKKPDEGDKKYKRKETLNRAHAHIMSGALLTQPQAPTTVHQDLRHYDFIDNQFCT